MKNLLNITVFASAVLSIFSTSLTLYEVPSLKEALSVVEEGETVQESKSEKDIKRIYISHDISDKDREQSEPLILAENKENITTSAEEHLNVFGVKISSSNNQSNI
ncbi:MAG: hypothetical protein DHS20C13_00760 [Thermodesulfobacteriota bacterium]|nr:MAG: hypothetical protein DHS20C13_00760 [Thermodesulfobacteriota bacterium]